MSNSLQTMETTIRKQKASYFAKYRAFVAENADPQALGRVKLTIPSVLGEAVSDWALPCVPYGGGSDFGMLAVPPVGAQVIAEFLEGDPSAPVWTGTFWRQPSEVPSQYQGTTTKILKTESGHRLVFEDEQGAEEITLYSASDAELRMDAQGGIALTDQAGSQITLDAAGSKVTVEDANGNSVTLSSSGMACSDASGNQITTTAAGLELKSSAVINIEGSMVTVGGSGGEPIIKGTSLLALFNSHTHATGVGPSGPPIPPLTPAVLTTKSTAL